MNRKKKGQVPIEPILEILALLVFVVIIIYLTVFTERETVRINIEEAEIVKAKAATDIVKISLDNTWFISTVQAVFRAGNMEEHWFYTDPNTAKIVPPPLPAGRLCTNTNPRVCYPEDSMVENYMRLLIGSEYFNITKEFDLNDAETKIGELRIKEVSLEDFGVRSVISDKIRTESGFTTVLTKEINHENFISTRMKTMFEAGRAVVQLARLVASNPSLLFYKHNENHLEYQQRAAFILQGGYNQIVQSYSGIYSRMNVNTLVYVPNQLTGTGLLNNQGGLIITYDVDASFSDEFGGVASRTCTDNHDYDDAIALIVLSHAERDGGEWVWKFGDKKYPVEQITAMVKGIINQESGWTSGAISPCGAVGMMQMIPGTAQDRGLSVPNYACTQGLNACDNCVPNNCNSIDSSGCDLQNDQRFDAIKNIEGGVGYIYFLFDYFENRGEDEENLMKLVTVAYNGGPGSVDNAIDDADSKKYEDISTFLPDQTRSYVPAVLGCYPFYLGTSSIENNVDSGVLLYVDKQTALPDGYEPSDLVNVRASGIVCTGIAEECQVRSVVLSDLNAMINEARSRGLNLQIVSAYRSYATQAALFESYVQQEMGRGLSRQEAEQRANTYSAMAGHSEHQLGTTIDFSDETGDEDRFIGTPEQSWTRQHAEEYGFVLSYPRGKESLTGYQYEPWHYRYVGRELAQKLEDLNYLSSINDWTLNKYLRNANLASYQWPTFSRTITSCMSPSHPLGIDIADSLDSPLRAIADGEIIDSQDSCQPNDATCQGCGAGRVGNCVLIRHDDGYYSLYGHMNTVTRTSGTVTAGQNIGTMGYTGYTKPVGVDGTHLHFEIRDPSGIRLDPCQFIDCSQSTNLQCTPGTIGFGHGGIEAGKYYYHDEEANKFVQRPITLEFKVKDHIPVLACAFANNERYEWETVNDLLCHENEIWSCQRDILGLNGDHKLADHEFAGNEQIWQCVSSPQITPRFCLKGFDTSSNEECCKLWLPAENGVLCRNEGFCTGDDVFSGTVTSIPNPPSLEFTGEGCMSEDINKDLTPDQYCNNALTFSGLTPSSNCCSWDCQNGDWVCTDANNALCQSSGVCSTTSSCRWQCGNGVQPTGTCGAPPPTPPCADPNTCQLNCPLGRLANGICQPGTGLCCAPP